MYWWIATNPPGSAFVVSSAPTYQQVRAILWRELNRAHAKAPLGEMNQTEWRLNGELVAFGRKPADYDPTAFQGIHAEKVLVVVDEAAGVPEEIFTAAEGLVTSEGSRILAIGNPDDPLSHFAKLCRPGSGWHVIPVSALDLPAFTGEPCPPEVLKLLTGKLWVEERQKEWGESDPRYVSRVLGRFPEDAVSGVVPWSWVVKCQTPREYKPQELLPVELGMDVGGGGDMTVIRERRGPKAGRTWRYATPDAMEAAGYAVQAIKATGASRIKIDVCGIGWGVVGRLKELRPEHGAEVVGVNVGEASTDPARFPKLRDQIWWEVGRELSQSGGWDLSELDDETIGQLIAPRWSPDSSGRVKVEPKDKTRTRIGRSPDDADALLLAFAKGSHSRDGLGMLEYERKQLEAQRANSASHHN
jgi:hypothetical protein